ncbi:hypothetical protein N0V84_006548 [Fusarium piperis]|uniref:SMP-30/Gluconolactonase/LRE-like region domain-containing protein n=1 Tax=Fusarium piperis TaxID=1435070 RepID=A0A9W8WBQ4_9HYPO|nr:hypothetical protein N0V84_006548 [Fusarium piperis]
MLSLLVTTLALPVLALSKSLPAKTLGQLPLNTWLENIAVRPNGDLLATQMWPSAKIFTIRDPSDCENSLEELVSIPAIQSIYGIAEVPSYRSRAEKFIVVGSNSTGVGVPVPGSFSAWSIEFQTSRNVPKVKVKKISDLEKSGFLNGVVAIPHRPDAVLVADSANGLVGRLDLASGKFDASAFVFPQMAPMKGASLPIGVNGIQIHAGHLYFDNSFEVAIYRIPITPEGYPVKGAKPELFINLSNGLAFLDDFALDTKGNIYGASNFDNSVVFVNGATKKWKIVAGGVGEMTVAGSTAVAFGRGRHDRGVLYVSTGGALARPVNDTKTEGAKVVAIDTHP